MTKLRGRVAPLELGKDIDKYSNSGNRVLLAAELSPFETLEIAVEASRKAPRLGLLAVTDKRLVYVEERFVARPVILSIPLGEVVDVSARDEKVTGTIMIALRAGTFRTFAYVTPKDRTDAVVSAILRHLPAGERLKEDYFLRRSSSTPRRRFVQVSLGLVLCALIIGAYAVSSLPLQLVLITGAAALVGYLARPWSMRRQKKG
jgi:hypothetical protein